MLGGMLIFRLGGLLRSIAGNGSKWLTHLRNMRIGVHASTSRLLTAYGEPSRAKSPGLDSVTIIFILGPPGAGKGTQCAALRAAFPGKLTHLSYGDLGTFFFFKHFIAIYPFS